jgi:hypothetical protein
VFRRQDQTQGRADESVEIPCLDNMVVSRFCVGRNTAARDQKYCAFRSTYQVSENFITVTYTRFPDTTTKTVVGVVICKSVAFAFWCNVRLLPINGNDENKITA